jgi:hypothetical protein
MAFQAVICEDGPDLGLEEGDLIRGQVGGLGEEGEGEENSRKTIHALP